VVETSSSLDTDYSKVTTNLLVELVALQRAGDNATARAAVVAAERTTSPSSSDVWVNGLWFTSLMLSLSTALLTVLGKQWLRQYTTSITGTPRERAFVRQFRWEGFSKWHVRTILGLLPTLLHASLGLFLTGLVILLYPLHSNIARIVLSLALVLFGTYGITTILPIASPMCPYRTQFSILIQQISRKFVWAQFAVICELHSLVSRACRKVGLPVTWARGPSRALEVACDKSQQTAKDVERKAACAVKRIQSRAPELLLWLSQNTADWSAKRIAGQSLGACTLSDPFDETYDTLCFALDWSIIPDALNAKHILPQDKLESVRKLSFSLMSIFNEGNFAEYFRKGDLVLPTFEMALLSLYHCGTNLLSFHGAFASLPRNIGVSISDRTVLLYRAYEDYAEHYLLNIIEYYSQKRSPYFPHHIWKCLEMCGYLPEIRDQNREVWQTVVEEIQENREEYLSPLVYPLSHEFPITLAQFYAPALAQRGWLGPLSQDEMDSVAKWFPDLSSSTKQVSWAERWRSRIRRTAYATTRMIRPQQLMEAASIVEISDAPLDRQDNAHVSSPPATLHPGNYQRDLVTQRVTNRAETNNCADINAEEHLTEVDNNPGLAYQSQLSSSELFSIAEDNAQDADDVMERGVMRRRDSPGFLVEGSADMCPEADVTGRHRESEAGQV
jgi:hypothetical protein